MPSNADKDRYAGLDLDSYSKAMQPAVYSAYLQFIGSAPGREDVDVVEITSLLDEGDDNEQS